MLSLIICLSVLAAMLGCGDTPKRSSGKELRKATKQAESYYYKAQTLLANAPDGYDNLEVAKSLGTAAKILTKALAEHGKSIDPDDTPEGEIVNARTMLAMVYQLRGDCSLWKIHAITREVGIQETKTDALLGKVQSLYAGAVVYKQTMLESGNIAQMLSDARKTHKAVTKDITVLNSKIAQQVKNIQGLEKTILELSTKAAALRKESMGNISREQGFKKLQEAVGIENEIYKNEDILAGRQRELKVDKKNVLLLQIKLEEANGKIAAGETRKQSAEKQDQDRKVALAAREKEIKTCWADVLASQQEPLKDYPGVSKNSMVQNCQLAQKLAKQGENDFNKARKEFAAAARMDDDPTTLLIDDQAESLIGNATLMTRVGELQTKVKTLSERIVMVRKSMGDMQLAAEPVAPGITKFITETGNLASKIVDSYRQAVKLRTTMVRKIRDPKARIRYQRSLVNLYEAYAKSLKAVGNIDQAAVEIKKADEIRAKLSKSK